MPRIDARLIQRLKSKLSLSQSAVYARIDRKAQESSVPTHLAALLVARDAGVNFRKFASEDDLAMMRGARQSSAIVDSNPNRSHSSEPIRTRHRPIRNARSTLSRVTDTVFVVHGRNLKARDELTQFLRALDIKIIEWTKAVALTKKPNPYIAEIIDAGFRHAQAIVVLLTSDDEAKLKDEFVTKHDQAFERKLTGQPRQNVLFEAGIAFGKLNSRTVLVKIGDVRPMSDVAGIHMLHLTGSVTSRKQFISKLKIAGVDLNDDGEDWLSAGEFESL